MMLPGYYFSAAFIVSESPISTNLMVIFAQIEELFELYRKFLPSFLNMSQKIFKI